MNKILVFCGDDIVSSRKAFIDYLQGLQEEDFEVIRFSGKDLTEEVLQSNSSPTSLFGQKKALAIENLFSGTKSKDKEKIINTIVSLSDSPRGEAGCSIAVWEGKDFSKADQQKFPDNFVFKKFKLPSSLFIFLENLSPGKTKINIDSFHKLSDEVDPAFIFIMLIRQFRYLILASENELSGMPPWQSGKIARQVKLFKKDQLVKIYEKFLEIDYKQKTSQTPLGLVYELDLLLADI